MITADPEMVRRYLGTHTVIDTAAHFGTSKGTLYKFMEMNGIPKTGTTGKKASRAPAKVERPKMTRKEVIEHAQKTFNQPLTPRLQDGINLRSPHKDRKWHFSGQAYLQRLQEYEGRKKSCGNK